MVGEPQDIQLDFDIEKSDPRFVFSDAEVEAAKGVLKGFVVPARHRRSQHAVVDAALTAVASAGADTKQLTNIIEVARMASHYPHVTKYDTRSWYTLAGILPDGKRLGTALSHIRFGDRVQKSVRHLLEHFGETPSTDIDAESDIGRIAHSSSDVDARSRLAEVYGFDLKVSSFYHLMFGGQRHITIDIWVRLESARHGFADYPQRLLEKTTTDRGGEFPPLSASRYRPAEIQIRNAFRCDPRFLIEAPDGHGTRYQVDGALVTALLWSSGRQRAGLQPTPMDLDVPYAPVLPYSRDMRVPVLNGATFEESPMPMSLNKREKRAKKLQHKIFEAQFAA